MEDNNVVREIERQRTDWLTLTSVFPKPGVGGCFWRSEKFRRAIPFWESASLRFYFLGFV